MPSRPIGDWSGRLPRARPRRSAGSTTSTAASSSRSPGASCRAWRTPKKSCRTSASPDPEHVALSAEHAAHVKEAYAALPDPQRSLLDLAYYEGLSHSEIAERTGVPLGTVKTRIRTAMEALRQKMEVTG